MSRAQGVTSQGVTSYAAPAKWLHWIMAVIIIGMIPAGISLVNLPDGPTKNQMYDLHRSFGFLILLLAILRVFVKSRFPAPRPAASLTSFERIASVSVHHLLYLLIFLVPILGWAAMSAYGGDWKVFGLFQPPGIFPHLEDAGQKTMFNIHGLAGLITGAIVLVHIAGGLMHGFIKRDGVLQRMLPGGKGAP
jgi:cytochrome b561